MLHSRRVISRGFALPTVLIASVVLLTILAVSVSATASVRTALKEQYYAQLAQTAGEAGVAYAKACLAANGNVPGWTDSKPLKPNTDCNGNELTGATVKALVVAGGGSGGGSTGGGGGAGGLVYTESSAVSVNTSPGYPVTVGAGGAASTYSTDGKDGGNSSFNGIVAIGGGGGGYSSGGNPGTNGHNGGSGGGGQSYYAPAHPSGSGTVGQGNNGGATGPAGSTSGGGGAGSVGVAGVTTNGGANGGDGIVNNITGGALYYAAGGAGGSSTAGAQGFGGSGIGGNGSTGSNAGTAGAANTGSGGGGGWSHSAGGSGAGGSGVVIISYPLNSGIVATGGDTVYDSGQYKVRIFTTSGTLSVSSVGSGCPDNPRCSVTINGNVRSSFRVKLPALNSEGKAVTIPYSGYVEVLRKSNNAVWRTYTQPGVQAAVVPAQCSTKTTSLQGWNNVSLSSTQDVLPGVSTAQSITLANTDLYAGAMYYRKDFSVTTPGNYRLTMLTGSNQDKAQAYVDADSILTAQGATSSGDVTLTAGCHSLMIKLTNLTLAARPSRVIAALQKTDSSTAVVATDSSWRVTVGEAVHFSSSNYYMDPSLWGPSTFYTNLAWSDDLSARGIKTTHTSGYDYFKDNRTITVDVATPIKVSGACSNGCTYYLDGEPVLTGQSAFVTSANVTLQPGSHSFGVRHGATSTGFFYMAAFRLADNVVLTHSDDQWYAYQPAMTTTVEPYSYDQTFVPNPTPLPTGTVSVLVVGGGGGGGTGMGGGGGGGGVVYNSAVTVVGSADVIVGLGGAGAPASQGTTRGGDGGTSSFGLVKAFGGGGGGSNYNSVNYPPGSGGSGGGSPGCTSTYKAIGIIGQGNIGGLGGSCYYPGGGGGAGGTGSVNPGTGGVGVQNDILGTNYYWGGGGGGSGYTGIGGNGGNGGGGGGAVGSTTGGSGLNAGSPGGGGTTVSQTNKPGGNAGANTGGGGGGGSHYNTPYANGGGNGGSGIVVISYPTGSLNATGGEITTSGGRTIHTFKNGGTFQLAGVSTTMNVLVVAGGGSGGTSGAGNGGAGGGGAGGLLYNPGYSVRKGDSFAVTVGAGGAAVVGTSIIGLNGSNSVFGTMTAIGGGGGGRAAPGTSGTSGGSGGGGGFVGYSTNVLGSPGTPGQGYSGGASVYNNNGGGGGGAGGPGNNTNPAYIGVAGGIGGLGGAGLAYSISGVSATYAQGGDGASTPSGVAVNGAANTGNGGSASAYSAATTSGSGGSGIVIVSYITGTMTATGGTITTSGGRTIHTFTSNGTFTVTSIL